MNSGKKFYIPVHRWLARDQEDGEICREFPIVNKGQPMLPGREDPTIQLQAAQIKLEAQVLKDRELNKYILHK